MVRAKVKEEKAKPHSGTMTWRLRPGPGDRDQREHLEAIGGVVTPKRCHKDYGMMEVAAAGGSCAPEVPAALPNAPNAHPGGDPGLHQPANARVTIKLERTSDTGGWHLPTCS